MKCRLYPNKEQKKAIDDILAGLKAFHNMVLYDMFTNFVNTKEVVDKKTGEILHWPDLRSAAKADYINTLREQNELIKKVPGGALSTNSGIILADIKRQLNPLKEGTDGKKQKALPIERMKPNYYSKGHPRTSYTYQEGLSKITPNSKKCFYITLTKIGTVKVRGWNNDLRFGTNQDMNFVEYAQFNKKGKVTVTVKKDSCGDYWIIFKLHDVYKPLKHEKEDRENNEIGCKTGTENLFVLSDGMKYPNKRFKKTEEERIKALNQRLSRREGYSNIDFRKRAKEDPELKSSKRYEKTKLHLAKVHRKIARKRNYYNNNITTEMIRNNGFISVESLNLKQIATTKRKKEIFTEAAMGEALGMLQYKSSWYNTECVSIEQDVPTNKVQCLCGYIFEEKSEKNNEWVCPQCGTINDAEINSANLILSIAKKKNT
jgi:hypothetical protein